jgi:nitroimidazol reductase NimA-like FMN-containing flavoprotein (pyridoxamine 5'-phosphate oxidase superfamily)
MSWALGPDDEVKNTVRELLATNKTLVLSTSANDRPWIAGAYFAESDPFHLALLLETAGRSLANIRFNPNVAATVSLRSPFDLYLQGEGDAEMLDNDEQLQAAKDAVRAKAPEIELLKFRAAAVRMTIRHWRATDVVIGWRPGKELLPPRSPRRTERSDIGAVTQSRAPPWGARLDPSLPNHT